MDAQTIASQLADKKPGQFFTVLVRREAKTYKSYDGAVIEKESVMQGILCDYANRAPVKNAVEDGMRDEPELPVHIDHAFKIGNVKFWQGKNGKVYLCVVATGNEPKAQWYLGGEPCKKEDVAPFLMASESPKKVEKEDLEEKGQVRFFGISLENVLEVR